MGARDDSPAPVSYAPARPAGRTGHVRLWAGAGLLVCAAIVGVAAWLKPEPRGFGTHRQLGGAPCGLLILTGLPCPTCGMTTAFAHTVRGQWWRAFVAQPGGFVLALATLATGVTLAGVVIRGRWPKWRPRGYTPYRLFVALLVLLVGGWALKIAMGLATGALPYR